MRRGEEIKSDDKYFGYGTVSSDFKLCGSWFRDKHFGHSEIINLFIATAETKPSA